MKLLKHQETADRLLRLRKRIGPEKFDEMLKAGWEAHAERAVKGMREPEKSRVRAQIIKDRPGSLNDPELLKGTSLE